MLNSEQKKIINYNADQLFDIVLDIEKYPEFIPWCSASRIISNKNNLIIADLAIRYKFFNEKFRSYVIFNRNNLDISIEYTEGPLKSLFTYWEFKKIEDKKTLLKFSLNFEFKLSPLQKIAENFYNILEKKMIISFEDRAKNILGSD